MFLFSYKNTVFTERKKLKKVLSKFTIYNNANFCLGCINDAAHQNNLCVFNCYHLNLSKQTPYLLTVDHRYMQIMFVFLLYLGAYLF